MKELKKDSEAKNKVFLHLNAGGMLGGYIWYPILGDGPAVESLQMLNFNAVVRPEPLSQCTYHVTSPWHCIAMLSRHELATNRFRLIL